jgi:hypothetical protein
MALNNFTEFGRGQKSVKVDCNAGIDNCNVPIAWIDKHILYCLK